MQVPKNLIIGKLLAANNTKEHHYVSLGKKKIIRNKTGIDITDKDLQLTIKNNSNYQP